MPRRPYMDVITGADDDNGGHRGYRDDPSPLNNRPYRDDPDTTGRDEEEEDNDDDDEEEEEFEDEFVNGRGFNRGRSTDYASVELLHGTDGHDYGDDEVSMPKRHKRRQRRRTRRPPSSSRQCISCTCMCLCLLFVLSIILAVMVAYRYEQYNDPDFEDEVREFFGGNNRTVFHNLFHGMISGDDDDVNDSNTAPDTASQPDLSQSFDTKSGGPVAIVPTTNVSHSSLFTQVKYNPDAGLHFYNPFQFQAGIDSYGGVAVAQSVVSARSEEDRLGYMTQPHVYDNFLVFVCEGDLYLAKLADPPTAPTGAMKLTTTVGNVRTPKINPKYTNYIAYTATYTGHRELYLMDTRPKSQPAMRLTYWDTSYGITSVVGWKNDGLTVIFAAHSNEVGLPDMRLYEMDLETVHDGSLQMLKIRPVPLSQAVDGVWSSDGNCVFFTRFSQSSRTIRYTGGTTESLWAWCQGHDEAVPLFPHYNGTSKSPQLEGPHLFFMSDRDTTSGETPSTMNLFAMAVPSETELYSGKNFVALPLTTISCDINGMSLQEFSIDTKTRNVVLRAGADLYFLSSDTLGVILAGTLVRDIAPLDITVFSDFHEHQERLRTVSVSADINGFDVFTTPYGSQSCLLTVRGQLWVAPVVESQDDLNTVFLGLGQNLPARRYRVAPGTMTGGMVRILASRIIPMPQEKSTRRLAVVLATDPNSETAEHGFYILEVQNEMSPSFVDAQDLPEPFIGGDKNGGAVKDGGLGSIDADSVTVSPCGRRMAWTNTDGQISVMTMPMYQKKDADAAKYDLPSQNANKSPIVGIDAGLSWSPGGRYLAITHAAQNQMSIISIADLGDPEAGGTDQVADIVVGDVVQATPDRFNSFDPFWGSTASDFAYRSRASVLSPDLDEQFPTSEGATTLYFLSDRDVVNDVRSPWGTRAPAPHLKKSSAVWALPLLRNPLLDTTLVARKGMFGGGGASELWSEDILAVEQKLEKVSEMKKASAAGLREPAERRKLSRQDISAVATKRQLQGTGGDGTVPVQDTPSMSPSAAQFSDFTRQSLEEPSGAPSSEPSLGPTAGLLQPSGNPSMEMPGGLPSSSPSQAPSGVWISPSMKPSIPPSQEPSEIAADPSVQPSDEPSTVPSTAPSTAPSGCLDSTQQTDSSPTTSPSPPASSQMDAPESPYPKDQIVNFGDKSFGFMRRAFRVGNIPPGNYESILTQLSDGPTLILLERGASGKNTVVKVMSVSDFPNDHVEPSVLWETIEFSTAGLSTSRKHLLFICSDTVKVAANTAAGLLEMMSDVKYEKNLVDTAEFAITIWPKLEYEQMYSDAWRMLRDYFYDPGMNGIEWIGVYRRYKKLVKRCAKREDLDDALAQMASELSALHVFVYGGEYGDPLHGSKKLKALHEVASLGGNFERSAQWNGYIIKDIPQRDPDFPVMTNNAIWSPLSKEILELSGQRGLESGDIIVGINGESVMRVPDMHMMLRGQAGRSVRLDVVRKASGATVESDGDTEKPEPVIVVPLSQKDADDLRYGAWEWKTRQRAKELAAEKGFGVGYIHLRSMSGAEDVDAFFRGFYPDYDKSGLIIDVRHNRGGNIDSWLLDIIQRKAWMFWQGRATTIYNGGLGWDEQFAFRGHIVVLVDEKTSSDGEGFSRGVSELNLGLLVGTRTWGGGIWLSSDNHLVDGGIATAPEIGVYNDNFGWGLGVEQVGVQPDVVIDNNPSSTYNGRDQQLEKGIEVLAEMLERNPFVMPKNPGPKKDMSLRADIENCPVGRRTAW